MRGCTRCFLDCFSFIQIFIVVLFRLLFLKPRTGRRRYCKRSVISPAVSNPLIHNFGINIIVLRCNRNRGILYAFNNSFVELGTRMRDNAQCFLDCFSFIQSKGYGSGRTIICRSCCSNRGILYIFYSYSHMRCCCWGSCFQFEGLLDCFPMAKRFVYRSGRYIVCNCCILNRRIDNPSYFDRLSAMTS